MAQQVPDGATLLLLSRDNPAQRERAIRLGLAAIARGEDALFKHRPPG